VRAASRENAPLGGAELNCPRPLGPDLFEDSSGLGNMPVVRLTFLSLLLAATATAGASRGQNPEAPSAVRGLYSGGGAVADAPRTPIGFDQAPAATFVAPSDVDSGTATAPGGGFTPAPFPMVEGDQIIARVDGQIILTSDVAWQVNQLIKMNGQPVPQDQLQEVKDYLTRTLVMGLIDTKLLYADFRRKVPDEALPKIEESISKPFDEMEVPRLIKMLDVKDRGELEQALKSHGTSLKDVRRQFMEKTIAGEWLRQRAPKSKPITYDDLLEYYQSHLSEYDFPAQVKWEELMVRFDKFGGDRRAAWEALAAMGNESWKTAKSQPGVRGPVFAEVAKAKSHGFTAAQGGLHDWSTLGSLKCEELNEALANLPPGQMSPGIGSELGFHIVRVLDRKPAGRTPFTEAQSAIREKLEAEGRNAILEAELNQVRKAARVWTVFDGEMSGARVAEMLDAKSKRR